MGSYDTYYQVGSNSDYDYQIHSGEQQVTNSSLPLNLTYSQHYFDALLLNSTHDDSVAAMNLAEKTLTAIFLFVFIVVTIIGNILVILSVFTYRPLRSVQNFFIVSLASADLAVAILVMPFNIIYFVMEQWAFGIVFCDMWLTFDIMCCTASILNLCAIALDRYYAIHDPINYAQKRTLKRVLVMIGLVWGLSAVISIPPIIGWNNWDDRLADVQDNGTMVCKLTSERGYVVYSSSGSFYIPLIIMTVVYIRIFLATRRRLRQRRLRTTALSSASANNTTYSAPNNRGQKQATNQIELHEISSTDTQDDDNHDKRPNGESHRDETCPAAAHESHHHHHLTTHRNHHGNHDGPKRTADPTPRTSDDIKNYVPPKQKQAAKAKSMYQFLEERQKISLSKERRAARTLGIIMGVFVLSWLPFFLMYVILPFCEECVPPSVRMENFIVWLGYVNSGLNPVIYTIFNIDFRRSFKRLLAGKRRGV